MEKKHESKSVKLDVSKMPSMEKSVLFANMLYQGLIMHKLIKQSEEEGAEDIIDVMATTLLCGRIEAEA